VITDFDATVTKHHVHGTRCLSSSGKSYFMSSSHSTFHIMIGIWDFEPKNDCFLLVCTGVLNRSPLLPPENKAAFIRLFEKYYPIEICLEMDEVEKFGHMVDWYKKYVGSLSLVCTL